MVCWRHGDNVTEWHQVDSVYRWVKYISVSFQKTPQLAFLYVHSLMSYKGFMCSNKSLIQIEDLGRSNIILKVQSVSSLKMLWKVPWKKKKKLFLTFVQL